MSEGHRLPAGRKIPRWLNRPVLARSTSVEYLEPWSRSIVWSDLQLLAQSYPAWKNVVAPSDPSRIVWREFANFVRQARLYDDAAVTVAGSTRALLTYYSALNLAKAELMATNPSDVLDKQVMHGLSPRLGKSGAVTSDSLKLQAGGVFDLLYRKRIGIKLPNGTQLPVARVMAQIPELQSNIYNVWGSRTTPAMFAHAVATDESICWSVLLTLAPGVFGRPARGDSAVRRFRESFRQIEPPKEWKRIFGFSGSAYSDELAAFESRDAVKDPRGFGYAFRECESRTSAALRGFSDTPIVDEYAIALAPSLFKTRTLYLPPSLARYAAIFYLSSVVRYRPSRLDPSVDGSRAWLLDSLADESSGRLLTSMLEGITDRDYRFGVKLLS